MNTLNWEKLKFKWDITKVYEILYSMCIIMSCKKIVAFLVSVSNASTHVSLKNCIFFITLLIFLGYLLKKKKRLLSDHVRIYLLYLFWHTGFFFL